MKWCMQSGARRQSLVVVSYELLVAKGVKKATTCHVLREVPSDTPEELNINSPYLSQLVTFYVISRDARQGSGDEEVGFGL